MRPCEIWYDCKHYEDGWCWMESETVESLTKESDSCDYYESTDDNTN